MIVKLLTEHSLEFLSLKEGCRASSESTHFKMQHCTKSYATARLIKYPKTKWNDLLLCSVSSSFCAKFVGTSFQ